MAKSLLIGVEGTGEAEAVIGQFSILGRETGKLAKEATAASTSATALADGMVSAEKGAGGLNARLVNMSSLANVLGVSLKDVASAAVDLAKGMVQFASDGAQSIDTGRRFAAVAGEMGLNMDELRESLAGAFDDTTIQQIALAGTNLGLTGDNLEDLGRVATAFSRQTGESIDAVFKKLVEGAGTGKVTGLEKVVGDMRSLKDIAAEAGVSVDELSKSQRANLIVQELMSASTDLLATSSIPSMAEAHQRAGATLANFISLLQEQTASFVESSGILDLFIKAFETLAPIAMLAFDALSLLTPVLETLGVAFEVLNTASKAFIEVVTDLTDGLSDEEKAAAKAAEELKAIEDASKAARKAQDELAAQITDTTKALDDQAFEEQLRKTLDLVRAEEQARGESLSTQERAVELVEQELRAARDKEVADRKKEEGSRRYNSAIEETAEILEQIRDAEFPQLLIETAGGANAAQAEFVKLIQRLEEIQPLTLAEDLAISDDEIVAISNRIVAAGNDLKKSGASVGKSLADGFFSGFVADVSKRTSEFFAPLLILEQESQALGQRLAGAVADGFFEGFGTIEISKSPEVLNALFPNRNDVDVVARRLVSNLGEALQGELNLGFDRPLDFGAFTADFEPPKFELDIEAGIAAAEQVDRQREAQTEIANTFARLGEGLAANRAEFDAWAGAAGASLGDVGGGLGAIEELATGFAANFETFRDATEDGFAGAARASIAGAKIIGGALLGENASIEAQAGLKGAIEIAESIASFATGDFVGGALHALAATKFFIAAGTGAGASTGASAAAGSNASAGTSGAGASSTAGTFSRPDGPGSRGPFSGGGGVSINSLTISTLDGRQAGETFVATLRDLDAEGRGFAIPATMVRPLGRGRGF